MRQPQPDGGQPAGGATPPGQPEPVEPSSAGRADDRDQSATRLETSPASGATDPAGPVDSTAGADRPVGEGAAADPPRPTSASPGQAADPDPPCEPASRDDGIDAPTQRASVDADPDDGTNAPTRRTGTTDPDADPDDGTNAPTRRAGVDADPDDGTNAPTRPASVDAPRWTGSAAVPPPQSRRRRRWFGGGEPAAPSGPPPPPPGPDRPSAEPPRPDPTLRMPGVDSDYADMPTPVDPWAGVADDPWLKAPGYPLPDGQPPHPPTGHGTPAGHGVPGRPGTAESAAPVSPPPHPVSPPPHPVSPPPHPVSPPPQPVSPPPRQLPATRVFPAPAGSPAPAPTAPAPGAPAAPRPRQTPEPTPRRKPVPPQSAPPPPSPAPVRPRLWKRSRATPPPQVAPPGWKPPQGYVPIPVRRRRRWPRFMLVMTLLSAFCCCGVPGYYLWPAWQQYPAQPADPLPQHVRDLRLQDDRDGKQIVGDLKADLRARNWLAEKTFAAVYRDRSGKRATIFGTTGFRFDPESDVTKELDELRDQYGLATAEPFETGVRGEYRSCTTGRENGESVVLCTMADHGSLVTGLFTRRNLDESAELLAAMRAELVLRQ